MGGEPMYKFAIGLAMRIDRNDNGFYIGTSKIRPLGPTRFKLGEGVTITQQAIGSPLFTVTGHNNYTEIWKREE